MKYLIISLLTVCLSFSGFSQDSTLVKGRSFIGGGFDIGISNNTEQWESDYNMYNSSNHDLYSVDLYFGRFVKKGLAIGLKAGIGNRKSNYYDEGDSTNRTSSVERIHYNGGLFFKKFFPIKGRFGVYVRPSIGYTYSKEFRKEVYEDLRKLSPYGPYNGRSRQEGIASRYIAKTDLGLYYFISYRFSIETNILSLSYANFSEENERWSRSNRNGTYDGSYMIEKTRGSDFDFDFINEFTLSKLFVINYYF